MYQSAGDRLPVDCLLVVMDFLNIRQVFVVMSVSRNWESAARLAIRNLSSLALTSGETVLTKAHLRGIPLGSKSHMKSLECYMLKSPISPLDTITLTKYPDLRVQMMDSLSHMVKLRRLWWQCPILPETDANPLILRNCNTLTYLSIAHELPIPDISDRIITYKHLKELKCYSCCPAAASACPKLRKLYYTASFGSETLPHYAMGDFIPESVAMLMIRVHSSIESHKVLDLIHGVGRLAGLRVVQLYLYPNQHAHHFSHVFDDMHKLESVAIAARPSGGAFSADQAIASLCRNNPFLKSLALFAVVVTDDSLTSLSRLERLTKMELAGIHTDSLITTDGILCLMEGKSRLKMAKIIVSGIRGLNFSRLGTEVDQIEKELPGFIIEQEASAAVPIFEAPFGAKNPFYRYTVHRKPA